MPKPEPPTSITALQPVPRERVGTAVKVTTGMIKQSAVPMGSGDSTKRIHRRFPIHFLIEIQNSAQLTWVLAEEASHKKPGAGANALPECQPPFPCAKKSPGLDF
jgi:hypothetical protein